MEFEASEPATTEASGQTFTSVFFDLSHVSEANSASRSFDKPHDFGTTFTRNVVDPRSRDTLESPILNNTSVHVDKAIPVLGGSASSFFAGDGCHTSCSTDRSRPSRSNSSSSRPPNAKGNLTRTS